MQNIDSKRTASSLNNNNNFEDQPSNAKRKRHEQVSLWVEARIVHC